MTFVSDLEPKVLWKYFDEILEIPRGSKNEDQMRDYVIDIAKRNKLSFKQDAVGNVVVRKPGTPGYDHAPITIIQAHLDMVNEKNSDVEHDFDKDPIKPQLAGDYLSAVGTTLGSDNGIGIAAMLAIMEADDLEHGPLEFLFTIDEETGLTGAQGLGEDLLEGRQLLNLDTEEENYLCVGCAGGADSHIHVPLTFIDTPREKMAVKCTLSGLKGGHSGAEIHVQKGNAIKLVSRALFAVSHDVPLILADIRGGDKHNAIPRETVATVMVNARQKDAFEQRIKAEMASIAEEFSAVEPNFKFTVSEIASPAKILNIKSSQNMLAFLAAIPHGVVSMSYDIPELVETSTNLAKVVVEGDELVVLMSSRSSVASAMKAILQRLQALAHLVGATIKTSDGYPGWKPDMDSELLKVMKELHVRITGTEPEVGAVHAGLECGIIGAKYDGMDMISFGPRIDFPHSPDERVQISTVQTTWKLLVETLEELAKKG